MFHPNEWVTVVKMKPTIKEKWVEALRSGDYEQTTLPFLRTEAGFSCLGVLCDIFAKDNDLEWKEYFSVEIDEEGNTQLVYRLEGTEEVVHLPDHVAVWAGLVNKNGTPMTYLKIPDIRIEGRSYPVGLLELDDEKWSFEEIAQVVEKNF